MTDEILLALNHGEYNNEQQRLLRNKHLQKQARINLVDGLLPYMISNENLSNVESPNDNFSSSSEPSSVYDFSYDIDFDLLSVEDFMENNQTDDLADDKTEFDDNMSIVNEIFSSKAKEDFLPLHPYTNVSTNEFCTNLLQIFRQANLCKTYSSDMLKLIHLALPQPNNLPNSIKSMLKFIKVENLFNKRKVCLSCQIDIDHTTESCYKCASNETAEIFDIDCQQVFIDIVERHLINILKYREKILLNSNEDFNNDIPFQKIYRSFLKTSSNHPFISGLIHIDGVSLGKSSKLTLWILSCSILELPPSLRNKKENMIILSIWVAARQPIIKLWLVECIRSLKQLKSTGFSIGSKEKWFLYFIALIADCPAMKLALNHIGNNGYFACWLCKIQGVHVDKKRQYHYEEIPKMRNIITYIKESNEAEMSGENVNGHLGLSIFHELLDVPLPNSIIIDYMHVTLLRHARSVIHQMYKNLKPAQRSEIDYKLQYQNFPHIFHRKLKPISFGNAKASEIRNLLLYALLPIFSSYLPVNKLSHIALFVCAIRILHGQNYFGDKTSILADELIKIYYKDHHIYYDKLENLVLHLHLHYAMQYQNFGSLSNNNCFAQESFIGAFSKNKHGTRSWSNLLVHYYNIDYALQKHNGQQNFNGIEPIDRAFDASSISMNNIQEILSWHEQVCDCKEKKKCITIYYRCTIRNQIYHSINYPKRQSTNSSFVQYTNNAKDTLFGSIIYFFTHKFSTYALIHNHPSKTLFSDIFTSSIYHTLLKKCINLYFYIFEANGSSFHYIPIQNIMNFCIVFEKNNSIIVTPISNIYEHD